MKSINTVIIMFLLCSSSMGQQAKTFFKPDIKKVHVGDTFTTQIDFYTGNEPISAFDIHLRFDPEILKVVSIKILHPDLFNYHRPFKFDNRKGKIDASAYLLNNKVPSEQFAIAEITFVAISAERAKVEHVLDDFPKTVMAYGGVNMLADARNFEVIIEGENQNDLFSINESDLGLEIWPNPSNVSSQVQFEIPFSDRVKLGLFDIKGNLISEIFEGNISENTPYQFNIDVQNLSNGVYSCRLLAGELQQTKILVVSK